MHLVSIRSYFYRLFSVLLMFAMFTGCAYDRAVNNLAPEEQNAFRAYRKVIKPSQARAYLSQPNAAARSAYLREIGIQQRFDALEPQDRESVLNGYIRKGMSAEALHFLWGSPRYTIGAPGEWQDWFYRGDYSDLLAYGNHDIDATQVRVRLVDSQVEWWSQDEIETHDDADDSGIPQAN